MNNQKQIWKGKSGQNYEFGVFDINFVFNPNQVGNYIFAKRTLLQWEAVYIGEGDIKERTESHKRDGCVIRKGATHIHAHLNNNEKFRKSEEYDLLAQNTEAYAPIGCNIKPGG